MNENPPQSPEAQDVESRSEKWKTFLIFLTFSLLEVGVLAFGDNRRKNSTDWIIVAGAIFFPVMTVFSWRSLQKNWTVEESDRASGRVFAWIVGPPIVLGAIILGGVALFSFFGWLGTIPAWAAVIIVFLLFK